MPHIRPAGADAPVAPRPGKPHKPRAPRKPRARRPRKPAAAPGLAPEPLATRSIWPRAQATPGAIAPLLALDPAAPPAHGPLTLTGAEHGGAARDLRATLAGAARERDAALNRMWRRPGGLTRLAGL